MTDSGKFRPSSEIPDTLYDALEEYCAVEAKARGWAPGTTASRKSKVLKILMHPLGPEVLGMLRPDEFERGYLIDVSADLADNYDPSYVRKIVQEFKTFWRWLGVRSYIPRDAHEALDGVEGPQVPTNQAGTYVDLSSIPSRTDIIGLAHELPTPWDTACRLSAFGGLRYGEVAGLRPADVDVSEGSVAVRRQFTQGGRLSYPKHGKLRTTFFPGWMEAELLGAISAVEDWKHPLFPVIGNPSQHMRASRFYQDIFNDARRYAGWWDEERQEYRWSWHDLRHHAATWMITELGLPIPTVAALLGHSSPKTTMEMYVDLDADAVRRAREAADGHEDD